MTEKEEKAEKINRQVKRDRAARRKIEIEMQIPQEKHKIHKTTKKDRAEKRSNKVRDWEDEDF